jgi:hypothetical protein
MQGVGSLLRGVLVALAVVLGMAWAWSLRRQLAQPAPAAGSQRAAVDVG